MTKTMAVETQFSSLVVRIVDVLVLTGRPLENLIFQIPTRVEYTHFESALDGFLLFPKLPQDSPYSHSKKTSSQKVCLETFLSFETSHLRLLRES